MKIKIDEEDVESVRECLFHISTIGGAFEDFRANMTDYMEDASRDFNNSCDSAIERIEDIRAIANTYRDEYLRKAIFEEKE